MTPPSETLALSIIERLQRAGHVAYLAGGCVRDRLMGREPKDYDVATSARPEELLAIYPRGQQVGVSFGVVLVRGKKAADGSLVQVEVATFRADGTYSDGRRPDSVRFTDAREDAQRRDFTCNGLFFDPLANAGAGELHDFVGGKSDIDAKILRAIGDPEARFKEDHLRMLRAVRFAGKLEFEIDPGTLGAMQRHAEQIKTVSRERVHDEMELILAHRTRVRGAILMQDSGLMAQLWPQRLYENPEVPRSFFGLAFLPDEADFVMTLATVCRDVGTVPGADTASIPPALTMSGAAIAELFRAAFMLSNVETADLAWLIDSERALSAWESFTKAPLKRLLADPRWPRLEILFGCLSLHPAKREAFASRVAALQKEGVAPLPLINGQMLIKLGTPPGPAFRGWLEQLYDRQLEGELRTRDEAIDAAKKLIARAD